MYEQLDGYHAYYAYSDRVSQYNDLNILVQLASAAYWKKYFGKIHLVCNLAHLKTLEKYGVDKIYDSIDTTTLDEMKSFDKRYWSLAKIHLANKLACIGKPFTILDTDLWLRGIPALFDLTKDFIGLHREAFDINHSSCAYPEPKDFIGEQIALQYDWTTLPINTGLMYFSNFKLVKEWYSFAMWVLERNKFTPHPKSASAVETIFIEQRALATLSKDGGYSVGTLIPSTYHTHLIGSDESTLLDGWVPAFKSSQEMIDCFNKVKHVWGLKSEFGNPLVRKSLIDMLLTEMTADSIDLRKYESLLSANIMNNSSEVSSHVSSY